MGRKSRLPKRLPKSTERAFPNLTDYEVTSPKDRAYNCIAFAAGDTTRKWDPGMLPQPGYYWPPAALAENNGEIEALKRLFRLVDYEDLTTAILKLASRWLLVSRVHFAC